MCKNKKEKTFVTTVEATTQVGELLKPLNYHCHIYGIVGHN
jgi:hypothetical protein